MNETQKVQNVILSMREGVGYSITQIAKLAGVKYGIAKKTLGTADCTEVNRSGGPRATRQSAEPKTVFRVFNAVTERWQEQEVPIKCRKCRFANTGLIQTKFRNKDTVSGCIVLVQRKLELSEDY